jgi:hypothetical protein
MAYLLDANVFIQAKNLHYGLDFCPAFWDWLIEANAANTVFSIEKVGDEVAAGADDRAIGYRSCLRMRPEYAISDRHLTMHGVDVPSWITASS